MRGYLLKVFRYVIIYIITVHVADQQSLVNDYDHLILVQHSPITSLFMSVRSVNINSSEMMEHLTRHWKVFEDQQRWIIRGLWPISSLGQPRMYCETPFGKVLTYDHDDLDETFKQNLKTKWPNLRPSRTEKRLWKREYNKHGSCVSIYTSTYFDDAVRLLDEYNVGSILDKYEIHPGNRYAIDHIVNSIKDDLQFNPFLKCLTNQNTREQYLLEVHICFDKKLDLVNCPLSGTYGCDANTTVIYPGIGAD